MQPIRLLFEGDPAAAAPWVGLAKKLARQTFMARIRNKTYVVADGVQIRVENLLPQTAGFGRGFTQQFGGTSKVTIVAAQYESFLSSVWKPEGLLLTPRSEAVPHGYGFPKRTPGILVTEDGVDHLEGGERINPPFGTALASAEAECMNQVLINCYPNNKYIDHPDYLTGLSDKFKLPTVNDRLRDTIETKLESSSPRFITWPLAYTPRIDTTTFWEMDENRVTWIDIPGENKWTSGLRFIPFTRPEYNSDKEIVGEIPGRQFDEEGNPIIKELETEDWYCHWPEELLYDNPAYEEVFRMTNEYRAAAGRDAIFREVRGSANHARMILTEMQRAKVQFHDNEGAYRPGYGTLDDRGFNAATQAISVGENLVSGLQGTYSLSVGNAAAVAWRHSPLHYDNMISSEWSEEGYCTSLDVFGGMKTVIDESGNPYPDTFDPPITGSSYAQIFVKRERWLDAGSVSNVNQWGRVSTFSRLTPTGDAYSTNSQFVAYSGKTFSIKQIEDLVNDDIEVIQLGGTLFIKNGVPYIRVLFMRNEGKLACTFLSYTISTKDFAADWELEAESDVFDNIATKSVSSCTFSPDGTVGVFSTTRIVFDTTTPFHLSTTLDHPIIRTIEQIAIQYTNNEFTVLEVASSPEITYTVVDRVDGEDTYLHSYKQEGSGEVELYPTYNQNGDLVRLKLNTSVFVEQIEDTTVGETTIKGKDEVIIHDYITFPSEQTMVVAHFEFIDEAFVGEAYFIIFHYLNLDTEDMVYSKINCTLSEESLYASLTMYVNDVVVKTIPSQFVNSIESYHQQLEYFSSGGNDYAKGVRNIGATREFISGFDNYAILPYRHPTDLNFLICSSKPSIKYYPGRLLEGTQKMSLGGRDSNFSYCYSGKKDGAKYFISSYNPTLAIGAQCAFARYKDRYIVQFSANRIFCFEIPEEEQRFVYANFDLDQEVGIGEMKWIYPIGVV